MIVPGQDRYVDNGRSFVSAADWNGDGIHDLLSREGGGIMVGIGPFVDGEKITVEHTIDLGPKTMSDECDIADFTVADWDRDGKPDLLVRWESRGYGGGGAIVWHRNLGGPGMTKLAEAVTLVSFTAAQSSDGFCVCDMNADGKPDLVVVVRELLAQQDVKRRVFRESVLLYRRE
jgi:hypothetical protein